MYKLSNNENTSRRLQIKKQPFYMCYKCNINKINIKYYNTKYNNHLLERARAHTHKLENQYNNFLFRKNF